jgi:hypothetical protein
MNKIFIVSPEKLQRHTLARYPINRLMTTFEIINIIIIINIDVCGHIWFDRASAIFIRPFLFFPLDFLLMKMEGKVFLSRTYSITFARFCEVRTIVEFEILFNDVIAHYTRVMLNFR